MKYSIVFNSLTGNTAQLADTLRITLPREDCVYFGPPDKKALEAAMIFVGFWTDKGVCDEATAVFLRKLKEKTLFLFGTAGFEGKEEYFAGILKAVKSNLDMSNKVEGSFMCQGKMQPSVLQRYENMLLNTEEPATIHAMIDNFNRASPHPDQTDCEKLKETAWAVFKSCQ